MEIVHSIDTPKPLYCHSVRVRASSSSLSMTLSASISIIITLLLFFHISWPVWLRFVGLLFFNILWPVWLRFVGLRYRPNMMTSLNGNVFHVNGPLQGKPSVTDAFPPKGQWRGALLGFFICAWTNGCANNRDSGDLRRHRPHYDVTAMFTHILSDYLTGPGQLYVCAVPLKQFWRIRLTNQINILKAVKIPTPPLHPTPSSCDNRYINKACNLRNCHFYYFHDYCIVWSRFQLAIRWAALLLQSNNTCMTTADNVLGTSHSPCEMITQNTEGYYVLFCI